MSAAQPTPELPNAKRGTHCAERLVRQTECPKCGARVLDVGIHDGIGRSWSVVCSCGWWREFYMPDDISPNKEVSDAGPLTPELKPKREPGIL